MNAVATFDYVEHKRPSWKPLVKLFLLAAVALSTHAVVKHGSEALAIHRCIENNGPMQTWKSTVEDDVFYELCELPDGRVGMRVMIYRLKEQINRTAFVPKDGSWMKVTDYLSKFATRYNGGMP
jgi:hypothetical protein